MQKDLKEIEKNCVAHLDVDFMPLHDLVREFSGFDEHPTEKEFLMALEFLEYLINSYNLKYLKGPEMIELGIPIKKLIENLKENWSSGRYEEINYTIWLEKP